MTGRGLARTPSGHTITGELGRGGMGVVSAATDDRLNREVSLKMLLRSGDERSRPRFLIEAEAMAQARHPNVVRVFEAGERAGHPYSPCGIGRRGEGFKQRARRHGSPTG